MSADLENVRATAASADEYEYDAMRRRRANYARSSQTVLYSTATSAFLCLSFAVKDWQTVAFQHGEAVVAV